MMILRIADIGLDNLLIIYLDKKNDKNTPI